VSTPTLPGTEDRGVHDASSEPLTPSFTEATTPSLRRLVRRWSFWLIAAAVVIVGALVLLVAGGNGVVPGNDFAIDNAAPGGSMAVAEVLRSQGVTVTQAGSLAEAKAAAAAGRAGSTTVFFYDPQGFLPVGELDSVRTLADRVVLFQPTGTTLDELVPSIAPAGAPQDSDTVAAGCSLPAAERAGEITPPGVTYRATSDGSGNSDGSEVQSCFRSYDNAYSTIRVGTDAKWVSVLGASEVLRNDGVSKAGNAALAFGLLGETDHLVWYLPTEADLQVTGPPSLVDLTPGWVTPLIVLAFFVAVAAAIWRGRRFGAVVIENLPVTVRSRETMEGRARLYAKAGAHPRALDALRIGTVTRLARILGLPRNATVAEVAFAAAGATGLPLPEVAAVLVTELPASEADLMRISDRLLSLEKAVAHAVRPDR
jgi:hypothetical protein